MGQTLTHGIYLPDEGERNCYNGLAGNWQLLDGAVGTVAEHTSQIAGKAPAVHTHSKSDITDFPAYGNAAGTICEGNDSRLSDARTPVAHTHGKSDVTDLFNSANVWSNANTFTRNADDSFLLFKNTNINALVPTDTNFHYTDLNFFEVNSKIIGKVRSSGTRSKITTEIAARSWSADGTTNEEVKLDLISDIQNSDKKTTINSDFIPSANNSYNLGSASYQWNNLYAKNYYYNGVAWGLDKANEWTGFNTFTAATYGNKVVLKNTGLDLSNGNSGLTDTYTHFIQWVDNRDTIYAIMQAWTKSANSAISISNRYKTDANTTTIAELRFDNSGTAKSFYANSNGDTDLGTSSKKWKTLNGINPGALSLPSGSSANAIEVDITNWYVSDPNDPDPNGVMIDDSTEFDVTSLVPGWLWVKIPNIAGNYVYARRYANVNNMDSQMIADGLANDVFSNVKFIFPITSEGLKVRIKAKTATVKIFPCLGNV